MKENNKLFVLLTDACNLECEFCNFVSNKGRKCEQEKETDPIVNNLEINKENATESLRSLVAGAAVIGLSGGGEPLLNINGILGLIEMASNKRFILTTNGSFEAGHLASLIDRMDDACRKTSNHCVLRLSIDSYHEKSTNYIDNLENLIKWYLESKWEFCSHVFFRTNLIDAEYVYAKFKNVCAKNSWDFSWEDNNEFAKTIKINDKSFRLILRPIVNAGSLNIKDKYNIYQYIDLFSKSDGHDIMIGTPKGCQGCQGCQGLGLPACQNLDGLDITINTNGEVTLYGGEISSLGSIYKEKMTYDILEQRMSDDLAYQNMQKFPIKKIIDNLKSDEKFKKIIEDTNYPYSVIKNLNQVDSEKLRSILINLN